MPIDIVCPSGLAGSVRGFKAKEAAMLADAKALREGATYGSILAGCWLATTNAGPYALEQPVRELDAPLLAKPDWPKTLECDRFWTLLKIRAATYGDNYEFTVQCQDTDCKAKIEWQLLLSDLPYRALPASSLAQLKVANEFTCTLPDGKACKFRLQTGEGSADAGKIIRRGRSLQGVGRGPALIHVLASRILTIDGVGKKKRLNDPNEPDPMVEYLGELDMPDLIELTEVLDEADGGVETTIEIECQECSSIQRVELPLGVEFFLPKKKRKDSLQSATDSSNQ